MPCAWRIVIAVRSEAEKPASQARKFSVQTPGTHSLLAAAQALTQLDCYLQFQKHQLSLHELEDILEGEGLRLEQHRFYIAPRIIRRIEDREDLGMMLFAAFRHLNVAEGSRV